MRVRRQGKNPRINVNDRQYPGAAPKCGRDTVLYRWLVGGSRGVLERRLAATHSRGLGLGRSDRHAPVAALQYNPGLARDRRANRFQRWRHAPGGSHTQTHTVGVSLTSHLASTTSPIGRWFREQLRHTSPFLADLRALGGMTLTTTCGREEAGPVGHAFDYLVRAHHGVLDLVDSPASLGARNANGVRLFEELVASLVTVRPGDDRTRARHCYALGLFEAHGRTRLVRSPLDESCPDGSLADVLAIASSAALDDLCALLAGYRAHGEPLLAGPFSAGMNFGGSSKVGGADADLLAGRTLIDLKAVSRLNRSEFLWQLAGYALLDWNDQYRIDSVGLYAARTPALITWPLDQFLCGLAGHHVGAAALRASLRTATEAASLARRRTPPVTSR